MGLLRYPFKKRWKLLSLVLRPDEGQSLTGQNVGVPFGFVLFVNVCQLGLFECSYVTPGSRTRHVT